MTRRRASIAAPTAPTALLGDIRTLIDAARKEADEKLTAELSRLEALRAVNPNIRDDELAAIESNRQQVMDSLVQAGWRLDALRLIVVTHQ